MLTGILTSFQEQYPDIDVTLFTGTLQEVHEWLNTSIIDVGFVHHPAKGVESTLLVIDELLVLVARGHCLYTRTSVTLHELRGERLVMPGTGCEIPEIFEQQRGQPGSPIRYQVSESATILAMVHEGLGITILPRMMLPEKLEGVAGIPLHPARQVQIGLAVRSQETASPAATSFVQTAVAWVQQQASLLNRTS
jgi:DNA-binding transcriptional LysR family regulator